MRKLLSLLTAILFVGSMWGVNYEELYSADFTSVATHSYTQNKTFTLNSKDWTASVSQVNGGVFYLGCNNSNASKGVLNNNSTFSAIVTALAAEDATYNTNKTTAHAYALLFENAYDNVSKVEFNWDGGNNAFQVFVFGYTNSAWTLLDSTNYATSGAAVAGSVVWTGSATNFSKFAIAARPGAKASTATSKTLRAATFKIYKTATPTISGVPNEDIDFGTVKQHYSLTAQQFTLTGSNLSSNLSLAIDNSSGFTVEPTSITPTDGTVNQVVTISHSTENHGDFLGTLTISGGGLSSNATVDLVLEVTETFQAQVTVAVAGKDGTQGNTATIAGGASFYGDASSTAIALVATPASGYEFVNWTVSEDNIIIVDDENAETTANTIIGDVTITANFKVSSTPSLTVSTDNLAFGDVFINASEDAKTFTVEGANLTEGTLTIASSNTSVFTVSPTSIAVNGKLNPTTITVTPITTVTGNYSANVTISGGGATSKTVALTMNVQQTATVQWYINGQKKHEQTAVVGAALIGIPDATTSSNGAIAGKVFKGWAEAAIVGEVAEGSAGIVATPSVMPNTDKTYYAVYATETPGTPSLTKMSKGASLSNGDKIIIIEPTNKVGLYAETVSTSYVKSWSYTGSEPVVADLDNTKKIWDVTAGEDDWILGNATNGYLYDGSSNKLYVGETQQEWSLTDNNDNTFSLTGGYQKLSYRSDLGTNWRGGNSSGENALVIYKYSLGASTYSNYATSGPRLLASPTFTPVAGPYTGAKNVTITAPEGTIYYTTDGTDPTDASDEYTAAIALNANGTYTIKAIAIDGDNYSEIASATYTISGLPLSSMDEILAEAVKIGGTAKARDITFNNWVVSGVNGNTAYVTDGTKGFIVYYSDHGFTEGDILSGTANVNLKVYGGAAEITAKNSGTITINKGGVITVNVLDEEGIAALSAVNTGSVIKVNGTYDSSNSQIAGVEVYSSLYTPSLTNGTKYYCTGVYVRYNSKNEICPRRSTDVVEDTGTGVDNTDAAVKAVKTIVNGQLFIEKNGHIYNAMGQMVK